MEKIITLQEAARFLKVAPITLYRKVRKGEIPAARVGKGWRFHREQLEAWIKEEATTGHRRQLPSPDSFRHLSTRETRSLLKLLGILKSDYERQLGRIVLYGSRARGDFRSDSDIDLLITIRNTKELEQLRDSILEQINNFGLREDLRLQVLVLPEKEWRYPSFKTFLLLEKIRREGIPLYG